MKPEQRSVTPAGDPRDPRRGLHETREVPLIPASSRSASCGCYVARLSDELCFQVRWGAHDPACPAYRESGDPVDRAADEAFRARHQKSQRDPYTGRAVHELKIRSVYLEAIREQRKRAEIRWNDRDYREGDYLRLRDETGQEELVQVTHVVDLTDIAGRSVAPGWVALSIQVTGGDP